MAKVGAGEELCCVVATVTHPGHSTGREGGMEGVSIVREAAGG